MLIDAAVTGDVTKFNEALKSGCDINAKDKNGQTVLSIVAKCRPDLVSLLIKHGVNVNLPDDNRITPLHWAVEYDNTEIVELLLENGASCRAVDGLSETPLHWAAWTGHHRSAAVMLRYDNKTDYVNCGGFKPIDLAVRQGHEQMIKLLGGREL